MSITIKTRKSDAQNQLGFFERTNDGQRKITSNLWTLHRRIDTMENIQIKLEDMLIKNFFLLDEIKERLRKIENRLEKQTWSSHTYKTEKSLPSMPTAQLTGTNAY